MIFAKAARREFSQAAAGIFVALLAILTSTQLIRLLNDAVGGRLAPESVMTMLGFTALGFMPILLSLTLFMAVLLSLSRSYRDSEMVVWFMSGQSLLAWIRPVFRFAWPILLAIAFLSVLLSPWINLTSAEYSERIGARNDPGMMSPGVFRESKSGKQVIFVENLTEGAQDIRNIFVSNTQNGRGGVVFAVRGHAENRGDEGQFVVLEQGRRYEVEPGQAAFRVMTFESYAVRLLDAVIPAIEAIPNRLPIWVLLENPNPNRDAEVIWRFGLPISAAILVLLAIPLSFVNPRAGRSLNIVMAVLVYAVYNNLLTLAQAWVSQGNLPFWAGFALPHVLMLIPLIGMMARRMRPNRPLFRWRQG